MWFPQISDAATYQYSVASERSDKSHCIKLSIASFLTSYMMRAMWLFVSVFVTS